jgi:ABC-2 type transport system permease protein
LGVEDGDEEMMELPIGLKQIIAFTKRDFHSWTTYKAAVYTQLINAVLGVFSWGVGAAYVQKQVTQMYGTDYISFLVVGIAIGNLILPLVQGVSSTLNPWTLETILMTGISTTVFVVGNVMWTYIFSIITFIPYLIIGIYFFKVRLNVNIPSTMVAFTISAFILMGLAMISTGLRIVTKSTDPITWALNVLQNLFSGVTFPVTFLDIIFFPGISTISWFLPQTWVYDLCRLAMLTNASLLDPRILIHFLEGSVFAVILFPIGYRIFQWGVDRSKKEGTLGWY